MEEKLIKRFVTKFRLKSKSELLGILSNSENYQLEAIFAAKWVLKKKKYKEDQIPRYSVDRKEGKGTSPEVKDFGIIYSIERKFKSYFLSYQLSDFLSIVAIAFLCSLIIALVNYYSGERWLRDILGSARYTIHIIFLLSIHVVYKMENGKGNTFLGRVLHDAQYILMVILISTIYNWLHLVGWDLKFDESVPFYIGILIVSLGLLFFWEGLISVVIWALKAIFKKSPL